MEQKPQTKAGYDGQLFYGNAGKTAETLLTNVEDLFYDTDAKQPGGAGVFFRATPASRLAR